MVGLKHVILALNYPTKSRSTIGPVFILFSAHFLYTYEMTQNCNLTQTQSDPYHKKFTLMIVIPAAQTMGHVQLKYTV